MAISVTEPISAALARTGRILFKPFDVGKWFVLGFCAWLAYLGEGGGPHVNAQVPGGNFSGRPGQGPGEVLNGAREWCEANAPLVILLVALVILAFLVLTAIGLVLTWVQSRGKFMFLDGIVRNRGAVVEPWRQFKTQGNSLFWFRIVLGLIGLGAFVLIVLVGLAIASPDILAERFGVAAVIAIALSVILFLCYIVFFGVIGLLLEDFVVPAMYLRNARVMAAWGLFRRELLAGHVGTIILFYLMKIVLGMAIVIIAVMATCITCCLAALPYLGTVILLPLFVFGRCYTVCFIEQFGEPWRFFAPDAAAPAAASAGGPSG